MNTPTRDDDGPNAAAGSSTDSSQRIDGKRPEDAIGRADPWDTLMSQSPPDLHWTTSNVGEAMPGVLTPLTWSVWSHGGERCLREAGYAIGVLRRAERDVPPSMSDRFVRVFYGRAGMQVEFLGQLGDRMPGTTGQEAVTSIFGRVPDDMAFTPTRRRWPIIAWRFPYTFVTAPRRLRTLATETDAWWHASVARIESADQDEARRTFKDAAARFDHAVSMQSIILLAVVQPLFDVLRRLTETAGRGDVAALSGTGGAEMAVIGDIWRAARGEMKADEVISKHGFHGPREGELSTRVWRENREPLLRTIERYRTREESASPFKQEAAARDRLQREQRMLIAALPAPGRIPARFVLRLASRRILLRGVAKRSFLQAYDIARAAARRLGELLVEQGVIDHADDVFYLTQEELLGSRSRDARDLIRQRQARRDAYTRLAIPGQWKGTPEPILTETPGTAKTQSITGIGVSHGVVEGTARVVTDPEFADVEPDEILVAPTTDPSWSSIMFISAGLVVDIGGALSHAAVVARELGIPCVVNARNATQTIKTGDRVRIDGTTGTVENFGQG